MSQTAKGWHTMWEGRIRVQARKLGAPVQLGQFAVPPRVTMTLAGEKGAPDLRIEFEVRDGRPECREVHVIASADGRGIRTSDLGALAIDRLATGAFEEMAVRMVSTSPNEMHMSEPATRDDREAWALRGEVVNAIKEPPGVSVAELREVARVYAEHRASGAPIKAVELVLGYGRRTAARRIARAREVGLLTPEGEFVAPPEVAEPTSKEQAAMERQGRQRIEDMRRRHRERNANSEKGDN